MVLNSFCYLLFLFTLKVKANQSKSQLYEVKHEKSRRNVILAVFRIIIMNFKKIYFLLENIFFKKIFVLFIAIIEANIELKEHCNLHGLVVEMILNPLTRV